MNTYMYAYMYVRMCTYTYSYNMLLFLSVDLLMYLSHEGFPCRPPLYPGHGGPAVFGEVAFFGPRLHKRRTHAVDLQLYLN